MSTDPPSPAKVAVGDCPFIASLYARVHKVTHNNKKTLHQLQPPEDARYCETDIFACPGEPQNDHCVYIFDPVEFAPSPDKVLMESMKEKFYNHIKLSGRLGDGKAGAKYLFQSLRNFGPVRKEGDDEKFQAKKFYLKCSHSDVARVSTNSQKKTNVDVSLKLASTNGTRTLHGRPQGNKQAPRKSCE